MILVWRGWGILCVLIPGGLVALAQAITGASLGQRVYDEHNGIIVAVMLIISAVILWFLGKRLNSGVGRTLVDEQTGQRIVLRRTHSLFWIKMEYWAIIIAIAAVVVLLGSLATGGSISS